MIFSKATISTGRQLSLQRTQHILRGNFTILEDTATCRWIKDAGKVSGHGRGQKLFIHSVHFDPA